MTLQFDPDRKPSGFSATAKAAAALNGKPAAAAAPEAPSAPQSSAPASIPQAGAPDPGATHEQTIEARLEAIFRRMIATVNAGELAGAEGLSAEALELAKREGTAVMVERFQCNRANILALVGRGDEAVVSMRKLLLSSKDTGNRFLAAYAIAQHHFVRTENERSMFYARQAFRYAEEQASDEHLAWCNNLLGTLLLRESYFEEACVNLEDALKFYPAGYERAGILANLGYCLAVNGRITLAFRHMMASLRMMNQRKLGPWRRFPHLALAYAYLEIGRHRRSIAHAQKALQISAGCPGADEQWKNSLYLLGEAKKICGRDGEAYEHFTELQKHFYPEQPFIVDVLMATDVRKMINLMA